ncbi:GAF domain-containing sensor histidine kinase [Primorskyibacter flagellatus]|uniref:histidine kinase n=1 Tax=Primorskyibacter flagellatus TaxID=1387277 RepID=A0A1W2BXT9_9RHOB|nr:GAF domain-containing sensor histidine kinase [Primorskyibacter flagellatus]SMC77432.1 Signal transduction histidine kinase [Primorskyibacter flagellatus]
MDQQATTELQNHRAFLEGQHDFQAEIETILSSETIGVILETVMLATGTRFAAVARVTQDRWVACRTVDEINFGLQAGDEINIRSTFCRMVRDTSERIVFEDVSTDEVYAGHPIAQEFGIVSYASIPIFRSDDSFFGTLCAIDTEPRKLRHPRVLAMLKMFADVIGRSLETEERLEAQEQLVDHEKEMGKLQEEFLAVLGHDLRNPIAALRAGLRQLVRHPEPEKVAVLLPLMTQSVHRMQELTENMMLHAKARLGGGIRAEIIPNAPLAEAIRHVVDEVRAASPNHRVELTMNFDETISSDAQRIGQAVSNMLANAVQHGTEEHPIHVVAKDVESGVQISVANRGEPIPDGLRSALFKPFNRGIHAKGEGLGLGLHIAASIAKAHNGQLDVSCVDGVTTFSMVIPKLT